MIPDNPETPWKRLLLWGGGFLLLVILCLGAFAAIQTHRSSLSETRAIKAEGEAKQLAKVAVEAVAEAVQAHEEREKATLAVQHLTETLAARPRPPQALPAPEADPALKAGLETAGLKVGLVLFRGDGPSTLEHQDAIKVWAWNQEALRIPALELRLDAAERLVEGQAIESQAFKVEVKDLGIAGDRWQAAHDAQRTRAEALQEDVNALHKAATAKKWQTWALVAGSLAAGYVAGHR